MQQVDSPVVASDYLSQQVQRSWTKEFRNLRGFGLEDGMSVLDLGCGPGHFTDVAGMAACLPQFDPMPLRSLVESGYLSRVEHAVLRLLHARHQRRAHRSALVLNFMACGSKPAAPD